MTRDEIQNKISEKIKQRKHEGLIFLPTGTGKSKIIIESLDESITDILWVCASEKARDSTVKEEFRKWKGNYNIVTTICWHSLPNYDKFHQLVVLDEVQMITPERIKYFKKYFPDKIIAVTGTKPRDREKLDLITSLGLEIIVEKHVDEAVQEELISDYEVEIYYTKLNNIHKNRIKGNKGYFYKTEVESYSWYTNKIALTEDKLLRKKLSLARARFIYNLESKKEFSKMILNKFKDKRTVSFSKSIEVAKEFSKNALHSKMKKKDKKKVIEEFNSKKISLISTVEMVNTSENFTDVELIFINQLDSNPANYLQRQGRGLRIRKDYVAKIIIICVKDTQDESWVKECISSLDQKKIKHNYEYC